MASFKIQPENKVGLLYWLAAWFSG